MKRTKSLQKNVGVAPLGDPQKGITLIVLIITIIVMLILVGVTINVALNGGLFEKTKNASTKTQREIEREQLIATMLGAYNSRGSFNIESVGELPDGALWCYETDLNWEDTTPISPTGMGDWIITKNNNKFYIDSNGTVLEEKPKVLDNLIPDLNELAAAQNDHSGDGDVYIFANENGNNIIYSEMNGPNDSNKKVRAVELFYNNVGYMWFCDSYSVGTYNAHLNTNFKANKWYKTDDNGQTFVETTENPININSFNIDNEYINSYIRTYNI